MCDNMDGPWGLDGMSTEADKESAVVSLTRESEKNTNLIS